MDRVQRAKELFNSGCNCSQAVLCAYCDLFGMDESTAMKISEPFGGGMGRMRLTCGAVSGMFMLAGLKYSRGEANDIETRTKVYTTVRLLADEFKKINGSITCADLLGASRPKDDGAKPSERNEHFYKTRPCEGCVEDCAKIIDKYLLD